MPDNTTAADLSAWKTPEGVGIGSPEQDVVKAYGKPSSEKTVDAESYRRWIRGRLPTDRLPKMGQKTLTYRNNGTYLDLRAAEFGIRNGKVSFIWLSHYE